MKDLTLNIGFIEGISVYPNFNQYYLLEDKMVLALPYDSRLSNTNLSLDKLQNQNWIVREEGSGTREFLNKFLSTNKIIPKNIIVLGSNYAVKEAVRNNLCITIIYSLVASRAAENKELFIVELDNSYSPNFSFL